MKEKKKDDLSLKNSAKREKVLRISYKSLLSFFGYAGTMILSFIQGWYTRVAILPVYPYSQPRPIGWIAPASFLAMYGTIGGIVVNKNCRTPNQKRSIGVFIIAGITGIITYLGALYVGIKKAEIFSIGVDYGVYSNRIHHRI